jgi:23S rRNA (adenine2503-C2)-methyltransferase
MPEEKPHVLLGLTLRELTEFAEESGQPSYRGRQLFEALYRQRVAAAEQISTLSHEFRQSLGQKELSLGVPTIGKKFVSKDGTVRYLIGFADGQSVETVWMPQGDEG